MHANQNDNSNGFFKRLYTALKDFDKALDYDPLEDVTKKVQILEKEVTELKSSLANR
jgi:hypothetical protein